MSTSVTQQENWDQQLAINVSFVIDIAKQTKGNIIQYTYKLQCVIHTGYDLKRETFTADTKSKDNQSNQRINEKNQRKCRHLTYLITRGMRNIALW